MQLVRTSVFLAFVVWLTTSVSAQAGPDRALDVPRTRTELLQLAGTPDASGKVTFWFPDGADSFVLPFMAGVELAADDAAAMLWLRGGSPWELLELPLLGVRYRNRTLAVIVPWPHYAKLIVDKRIGITFQLPERRHDAAPCVVLAQWTDNAPLAIAAVWRAWRAAGKDLGAIPIRRSLTDKIAERPRVGRLLGAAHFYLWGNARFSHHDVERNRWCAVARALRDAADGSRLAALVATFSKQQRGAIEQLAALDWPEAWLTKQVAQAIDAGLARRGWSHTKASASATELWRRNCEALIAELPKGVRPTSDWGDGVSNTMLTALSEAGIDRALLLTSDLYRDAVRPDVIAAAAERGYLFGPYDSYHSVHSPEAAADSTWQTAQFDREAYEHGRIINADGSGHSGFKNRGFHFSPATAWPYMRQRVDALHSQAPFSTWFVDCDATGESFDDYHERHPGTRLDDLRRRRARLRWLADEHDFVVGSEGGSVLFSDVIDYGHGVDTPYIGHLDPSLRDRNSPHYLGRHWPPDQPEQSFKRVPVAPALRSPIFDPSLRIPLYRAALGDELITSHHWSLDSLKLADIAIDRELLELLTGTPPMYHISRGAWPARRAAIARHYAFWSPLHRALATAPLSRFEHLSTDRLLQRATYTTAEGEVTITVNFASTEQSGYSAHSATVAGGMELPPRLYVAK
tara:strand:+ start:31578 stop:33644 length:2067 start_codon:yes stop_codon:yes gene_type:complete